MDKIRKVLVVGSSVDDEWTLDEGKIYILFEDESKLPQEVNPSELNNVLRELATQQGVEVSADEDAIGNFYEEAYDQDWLGQYDSSDPEELESVNEEIKAAKEKAVELGAEGQEVEKDPVPVTPVVPVPVTGDPEDTKDNKVVLENEIEGPKNGWAKKAVAGGLAVAAAVGVGAMLAQNVQNDQKIDQDQDKDKDIDFNTASYEDIINSMDENDVRRQVAEQAMGLVNNFHDATHKEGNFRLEEDGSAYLDLSFEEALVLTTFANYSSDTTALYDILGSFEFTADEAQQTLESARTKIITYYMNATERSGLADMFQNPQDRLLFEQMEDSVLAFRTAHTTETSDQVLRNVYYNYILDSSTVAPNTSSMAKLLAFDTVYGGLILTESASVDHTQFLEFHGLGTEAETEKYVTDVLHLDYASLSEEEIATYSKNVIESGTELVSLLENGHVMNEENSTAEEMAAHTSLTDLVDRTGLCNAVNDEISRAISAVSTTTEYDMIKTRTLELNRDLAEDLREAGYTDLADQVEASLDTVLNTELQNKISSASAAASTLMSEYQNDIETVYGVNRPTMAQIADAARASLDAKENYAGYLDNLSTLIQNRRHGVEKTTVLDQNLTQEQIDAGIIGIDPTDGVPVVEEEKLEGMTEEEKNQFIIDNGTVIEEQVQPGTVVEETPVNYEDLTEEEKVVVDQEKIAIFTQDTLNNVYGAGQIAANEYENDSNYVFTPGTIVNPVSGTEYDLNEMNFASAVARAQAFANTQLNAETGLIERTGDFYIDADQDTQILNAAEVAAEQYLSGLSIEDQTAIAEGMGMSWEEAKEQLKASYKDGYIDRMQTAIDLAIQEGNEQFETTRAAQEEALKKSQESRNEAVTGTGEASTEPVVEEVASEPVVAADTEDEPVVEAGTGDTSANVEEEAEVDHEYDPNVDVAYGEGEVLIEDANGNPVSEPTPGTGDGTNNTVTTDQNAVVTEGATVVASTDVQANVEQTGETVLEEEVLTPATTGEQSQVIDADLEAAIAAAYDEALKAAYGEATLGNGEENTNARGRGR